MPLCLPDYYLEWHLRTNDRVNATGGEALRRTGDGGRDQAGNGAANSTNNGITQRKVQYWVITPEADAEGAARIQDVLETYVRPSEPQHSAVCRAKRPVQLVQETRAGGGDGASRAR